MILTTCLDGEETYVPIVRIHSSCLFTEAFLSFECDCRAQLDAALAKIEQHGGLLVYLFQEGRGIGLCAKIAAMELERVKHITTVEAFSELGFEADHRSYTSAVEAIQNAGVPRRIRAITNNPLKLDALRQGGFEVVERLEPELQLPRRTAALVRCKQVALGQIPFSNISVT